MVLVACGKPEDPLAGRWDVNDPSLSARGGVAYAEFKDGKRTVETKILVQGLGAVSVHQEGTYMATEDALTVTNTRTDLDVTSLASNLRTQAEAVLKSSVGGEDGQAVVYTLKKSRPDRLELGRPDRTIVLTRALGK